MKKEVFYFQKNPSRDEALDILFDFFKLISESKLEEALKLVQISDSELFVTVINNAFRDYLFMIVEDLELEEMEVKGLIYKVSNPFEMDEIEMDPQFSGKEMIMELGEELSFKLFLNQKITPVRVHFTLSELDGKFYFKLSRISGNK